jgi:hypothetical protein
MLLLSTQISIAEKSLRDDAFKILIDYLKFEKDIEKSFRFDELQTFFYSIISDGMIKENESYIEYTYCYVQECDATDNIWYLNASNYYDSICKKYSIYPKYLKLYNGQTD